MIAYALAFQLIFIAQYIMMIAVIVLLHIEIGISAQVALSNSICAWCQNNGFVERIYLTSDKRVRFVDELVKGI